MLSRTKEPDGQDIDDPLYGNLGGAGEEQAVARAAVLIGVSCRGLVEMLKEVKAELGSAEGGVARGGEQAPRTMPELLRLRVAAMGTMDWLVPPLLQGSLDFVLD
jgi:hypothetical protein